MARMSVKQSVFIISYAVPWRYRTRFSCLAVRPYISIFAFSFFIILFVPPCNNSLKFLISCRLRSNIHWNFLSTSYFTESTLHFFAHKTASANCLDRRRKIKLYYFSLSRNYLSLLSIELTYLVFYNVIVFIEQRIT